MDTSLLDLDRIPTLEELRDFFKDNDWSTAQLSDPADRDTETTEAIMYIENLMNVHFEPISREKGLPKQSACYSKNNPLIALRDSTEDLVASEVAKLIDEHPDMVNKILNQFDFADPDIDKKADDFLNSAIGIMLDVMEYESAAEIVKSAPAHEDFSKSPNNHAKQDFEREYYKSRTRHPQISLDDLTKNGDESALPNPDYDAVLNAENRKDAVRAFWKVLSEDEKKLLFYRMDGMTYEEISEKLNIKTHSAVLKRRRKIEEKFIEFYKKCEG